jgi:glycosyltransferase involved in cell wall biosynthesis
VDWFEVWSRRYWTRYLGRVGGTIGWAVQKLCVIATPKAFVFSRLHGERLREEGLRTAPVRLAGLYAGPVQPRPADVAAPLVVFAGRHIAEKRAPSVVAAVLAARERIPGLRGLVLGDGPERPKVLEAIAAAGAGDVVEAPGFVSPDAVGDALARASCLLLPSSREGYGLVVIEAAAAGTPSVVVAGEDNAAVELVQHGVNGFVASSEDPRAVADAVVRCVEAGPELRASTARWFAERAPELSLTRSAERVVAEYRR